jgi:hypothetical protein
MARTKKQNPKRANGFNKSTTKKAQAAAGAMPSAHRTAVHARP